MITVAQFQAVITANTSGLDAGLKQANQSMNNFASALAGIGFAAIGKEIAQVGLEFLALKEQAQIAFGTMLQSGELAKSFLVELQAFAAVTPFEFPDLIRAAQRLKAMGIAAHDVIPILTAVGDAAAALGASSVTIDRITLALGQMFAKGKVSAEEMRQLAEAGIPAWQILADKLGITVPEAMKKAEKGFIDGKVAVKLLTEGIENGTKNVQAFGGMMALQSKTFAGLASTIKDLGRQAIGDVLQPAFDKLRDVMAKIVEVLPKVVAWFQNLSQETKNGILAFGAFVTLAPVLVGAIGLIASALGALLSPIGLVVLAMGALSVAYAANLGGIRDAVNELSAAIERVWSGHGATMTQITRDFWGEISGAVGDNFHRIAELIRTISALIEGNWGEFFKHLLEMALSFLDSVGSIFDNIGGRIGKLGADIRHFVIDSIRELAGIKMDIPKGLEFTAPALKTPGLDFNAGAAADRMLADLDKKKPTAHKTGKGLGQAILDGFKEGADGLQKAFALVATKTDEQLKALFDVTSKSAKKGATELKNALGAIAVGMDEFFASFGAGVKVTKEQLAGFGVDFISVLEGPTVALKRAREGQTKELIALNQAFIEHNQNMRAVLKDGIILIESYGEDAAERISRNAIAADHAFSLNDVFAKANAGLEASLNEQNKIIIVKGELIAESAQGVSVRIGESFGTKLATELKEGIDAAGQVMAETWIAQFTNLKQDLMLSSSETIEIMLDAFRRLDPATQAILQPFVDNTVAKLSTLKAKVQDIKDAINKSPFFEALRINQEIAQTFDGAIDLLVREGVRLGETVDQITKRVTKGMAGLGEGADEAVKRFKQALNTLPGALDELFNKLALGAKKSVSGVFDIIGAMPGKFGDALRKTTSTITDWVNRIDTILKGLHKIFDSIPDGLGGLLTKVIGVFKGVTATVSSTVSTAGTAASAAVSGMAAQTAASTASATAGWMGLGAGATAASTMIVSASTKAGTAVDNMNKKTQSSVSKLASGLIGNLGMIAGAIGGIGMVLGVQGMGKVAGTLQGALGGLTAGASIGFMFGGPVGAGIGALIGGIGGAIAGFLGSGKTAEQKAAEARSVEQAKMSIQQSAQAVINAAIEGFDKALTFFEHLDEFTAPRKEKFAQFFKAFTKLMDYFMELSKAWAVTSLTQAKAAAEAIGPVADALASLPAAFEAINGHTGVADAAFDRFFEDMDKLMTRFFARSEVWIDGISKRAQKVANRLAPAVDLMTSFGGAFIALTDVSKLAEPTDEMFNMFDRILGKIVEHITNLSLTFDKSVLKAMANFSDKAGSALGLWKDAIDTIKATVEIPMVSDTDINNLTTGIEKFVIGMSGAMTRLEGTDVVKVSAFANVITPISNALKAWADTSAAVRGYTEIAATAWDAIIADFTKAIQLMGVLIGQATQFEDMATQLETKLKSGAQHLADGVAAMTAGVLGTASALQTAFGHIQGGEGQGTVAASSYSATSTGAQSTQINLSLTLNPNDPQAQSALQALLNLFGAGSGLDAVIANHS